MGFSADFVVHRVASPSVRQKRPMVQVDLKLMESIVVELRESVVHESVAIKKAE